MNGVGVVSYALALASFVILSLLLIRGWRGQRQGIYIIVASIVTAGWALTGVLNFLFQFQVAGILLIAEVVRNMAWCAFLLWILSITRESPRLKLALPWGAAFISSAFALLLLWPSATGHALPLFMDRDIRIVLLVLLALGGLILVETVYGNIRGDKKWAVKYLCLGVGGLFAYDFYLYADALLWGRISDVLWQADGLVAAMMMPLITIAAGRNASWSVDVFISRKIVLHSATLLGAGLYLLVMALGGYYVKVYGGHWGGVIQTAFFAAAILLLLVIVSSGHVRSYMKVMISKHFFNYKYDYRDEWLGVIKTLSSNEKDIGVCERVIKALSGIVDSAGGVLFTRSHDDGFELAESRQLVAARTIARADSLVTFLHQREWIIDLNEYRRDRNSYAGLEVPAWLLQDQRAWLAVPLMSGDKMVGIVMLFQPRIVKDSKIDWETRDLLKTVAIQGAAYLENHLAMLELMQSRQFAAFNKLSTYLVHDLKNVVAQLSLVVRNAEKHRNNAEFIDDMIGTVRHSADKMQSLLLRLKERKAGDDPNGWRQADLSELLQGILRARSVTVPVPVLQGEQRGLRVLADRERLATVIGHVIQNAQDATPGDGKVETRLSTSTDTAVIEIEDNGCGMSDEFIRDRLFIPFESTKGLAGMGIGAYECREYVRSLGGDVEVTSRVGVGTLFRISLPLYTDVNDI